MINSGGMGPDSSSYVLDAGIPGDTGGFPHLRPVSRAEAYACDITYGTNNELASITCVTTWRFPPRSVQRRILPWSTRSTRS